MLEDSFSPVVKLRGLPSSRSGSWTFKRLWQKPVAAIFLHQREALEPAGSLLECSAGWCPFLAQSDGALHKGNSITRLTLSL